MIWVLTFLLGWLVPCCVAATAAWDDVRALTLPNRHALFLLGLFPLAVWAVPDLSFFSGLAAALSLLLVGSVLFALRVMGGGDVKLAAVMGLYLGWRDLGAFLSGAAILAGLLALLTLYARRGGAIITADPPARHWLDLARRLDTPPRIPVGAALGAAFIMVLTGRFLPVLLAPLRLL